ncbi:MAG: ORC1-type DNA replication protein [Methanomicrobiaceae archaeon]|nr:ORC1-type DNA replication protein [Methanomicrobiaceae archaeon]
MNQLLKWEETLFRDLSAFESDYIPDRFLFREEQIKELSYNLRPALKGFSPVNTICRGLPGTGKTTCLRKLFSEAEMHTKKLVTVYVNCQIERSPFSIYSKVYRKVTDTKISPAGLSFENLVAAVAKKIAEEKKVVLLCLDDVNYIGSKSAMNTTLFTALRLHQEFEGVRIGVFAVLSDVHKNILDGLNAGVVSSFRPAEVYFPPYSAAEMHDIYQARILQGVYPNVISKEILDLIVDYSMKIGDLRVGLDLIKRSVMNAENDARTSVTEEDVSRAFLVSKDVHVNETVKTLKNGERQLFELIGEMKRESEEKGDAAGVTSGQVQRRAKSDLNIGYTYFFEYIKKLEELRLVDIVKKDGVHGRMSYVEIRG